MKLNDTLIAHEYLTKNLRILHQDISIGNVMITQRGDQEKPSGLLIDFDYSGKIEEGVEVGLMHSHDQTRITDVMAWASDNIGCKDR